MTRDQQQQSPKAKTGTSLKDTTMLMVVHIGRNIALRLPRFVTPPLLVLLGTIAAVILLFPYRTSVPGFDLPKIGEVSKETIIAPVTFDILKSREELERERRENMERVLLVMNYDGTIKDRVRSRFLDLRASLETIADQRTSDSLRAIRRNVLRKEVSENTIATLSQRPYLLDDALFQAEQALEQGIATVFLVPDEQSLTEAEERYNVDFPRHLIYTKQYVTLRRDSLEITVSTSEIPVKEIVLENIIDMLRVERMFDQEALNSLYELLDVYLVPNVTVDGEETALRRQEASRSVLPIKGKVIKDTEIVRKHQEVSPEVVQKLVSLREALDTTNDAGRFQRVLAANVGEILLAIFTLLFLCLYLVTFHADLLQRPKHLTALALIIVLQIGLIRAGLLIVPKLFEGSREMTALIPEYLIPTAVAAMLISILFDLKLSLVITVVISTFYGTALDFNHALFMYSLFGGLAAAYSTRKIRYRWDFFRAMVPVILTYAGFVLLWHLIGYKFALLEISQNIGLAVLNAILTTFLAMTFVAMFENLFDITTNMTLLELSDMNHPLLKRLSIEAAGTYNHSILVANLAESAAERINANPLLARVGAYYHDIGKIAKPNYFIENQKMDRNIHSKLNPSMSALVISSHVKDGIELARKHKLPMIIQDAITQHHGTSTVSFFYEKAREQDPHNQVQERDFRYPGPRPQSRENAIIMLADSIEAASRSLASSSPKLLRELVKKIIYKKFASSQLDECTLTFQDLHRIIDGFMPVLEGIFHTRIEYPNK
jgi:hypothetical protein